MRTMLLSFKPKWFEKIKSGEKIYEYRRTFADEEVMAYMYVSTPVKKIVGKIHLGKRIALRDWRNEYQDDADVVSRIDEYLERCQYAMPVLSFQMTKGIDLEELRAFEPHFVCPQMYYYLDNYPELFQFIASKATNVGSLQVNCFENVDKEDICRQKYKED